MRLTQIKLAGFKSFVDPTVIPVPGRLVGIVGPNGCGKSNIIDAVRWVMGESRASELRGESMQDVIFNGSGERKRSARASVELVFENAGGRLGGQWGTYAELSVRRVLTRDGSSTYFINSQVVRRRDINDIFLGTGLGARGYAIIGQGMINRLIEARPQELRVYLEEAAGVSRYKERRRETGNRLQDTRDNLVRLEDIVQELDAQLARLQRQARQARQYRELQAALDIQQQLLWFVEELGARDTQKSHFEAIEQAQLQLEALRADLRSHETHIETLRQEHQAAASTLHDSQGHLYHIGAEVSRLEAELRHHVTTRERLQERHERLARQQGQWQEQIAHSDEQHQELESELEILEAQIDVMAGRLDQAQHDLPGLEIEVAKAMSGRDSQRAELAALEQQRALAGQIAGDTQRQLNSLMARQQRLNGELTSLAGSDASELDDKQQRLKDTRAQLEAHRARTALLEEQRTRAEQHRRASQQACQQARDARARLQANLQALEALQESVGKAAGLHAWLTRHGLHQAVPLWQSLEVVPGWETAVEAVLGERMGALGSPDLSDWVATAEPPPARIILYELDVTESVGAQAQVLPTKEANTFTSGYPNLISHVRAKGVIAVLLHNWLAGVMACPDLPTALAARPSLAPGRCFVVPAGHIVDEQGVRFFAADRDQDGLLARQTEIRQLQEALQAANAMAEKTTIEDAGVQEQLDALQQSLADSRAGMDTLTQQQHDQAVEVNVLRQRHEQADQLCTRLQRDIRELGEEIAVLQTRLTAAERDVATASLDIEACQREVENQQGKVDSAAQQQQAQRGQLQELALQHQQLVHQQRAIEARMQEHQRNQQLAHHQQEQAQTELQTLQSELFGLSEADIREPLQVALAQRLEAETALGQARTHHDNLAARVREAEEHRLGIAGRLEPLQERIVSLQLEEQAARLAVEQHAKALRQAQADRSFLQQQYQKLPSEQRHPDHLQGQISELKRQVQIMGNVNLAALQELETANQRKVFLDSQVHDLQEAIQTLEDAIIQIDRETRGLLSQTFEVVNGHFGQLFPQLFGGGQAALTMAGDDILDAGVQVMAQPPGKRNTTIQLLSGGEKALTAIALVFSLFRLNPAPFCLLDEVDAPLDDANTGRFASLVKSMSEQTQFVFVSHNKITMQMATQLIGVTMQEQGVSRIVSVDMEAALKMADALQSDSLG